MRAKALVRMATAFVLSALLVMTPWAVPAGAVEPSEILDDPLLELRARDISKNLRCLVCQNQSIDDSNAELARDLRVLVRQRLTAGDSDSAVIDYVVARYGDYVLLKPPLKAVTYALWFGPLVIFAVGIVAMALSYRRRAAVVPAVEPLSADEKRRLDDLLDDNS